MSDTPLNPIVQKIAVELTIITGEIWRTRPDTGEWNQRPSADSESASLYFYQAWSQKNRIAIKASAPEKMREMTTGESITCDLSRTPEAIAQDIARRLLPHARAHLIESMIYHRKKTLEENAKKLRENMIKKYCPEHYNGKFASGKMANRYKERVWAELTYDNLVNIEINVPMGEALKLLKLLTQEKI